MSGDRMQKPYYFVYFNKEFKKFKRWSEAKEYIEQNEGCYYRRIESATQEKEFISKYKGKENYAKKIYIVICKNKIHRFSDWKDAKLFIDSNSDCYYRGFTNKEDAQEFVNKNIHLKEGDNVEDTLYCYISTKLDRNEHLLNYGYRLVKNNFTLAENFNELHGAYPADIIRKNISLIKKGVNTALTMKEERIIIVMDDNRLELLVNGSYTARNKEMESFVQWTQEKQKEINIDWNCSEKNNNFVFHIS